MLLSNKDREVCCFSRLCPNFPSLFYSWHVSISTLSLLTCVFRNGPSPFFLMHGNLATVNHKDEISLKMVETKRREKVFACFTPGKSWHIHHLRADESKGILTVSAIPCWTAASQTPHSGIFHGSGNMILSILIAVHCRMTEIAKGSKSQNTNPQTTPVSSIIF